MSPQLMALAGCLQVLFTSTAEELGRLTGFMQRQRQLTAAAFAQTLVFEWLARPKATLESMARHLDLSPQALQERIGPKAQAFLKALLNTALHKAWQAQRERLGLLDRFTQVVVEDTTVCALPPDMAEEFPGCGGGSGAGEAAAALKILVRWDVCTGALLHLSVHAGRTSDKTLAAGAEDLSDGSLHLADQGFFDSQRFQSLGSKKYWISRVPAGTKVGCHGVWQTIGAYVQRLGETVHDATVALVGRTQLPCRLVLLRCPEEVAHRRKQKLREYLRNKQGRDPSMEQLRMCAWTVLATNVPEEMLAAKEVWLVYRCRWQIELLFKRAKQQAGLGFSWGRRGSRVLVELYAKLLGTVVAHWATLLRGGPLSGISPVKRFGVVQEWAVVIQGTFSQGRERMEQVLAQVEHHLQRVRPQPQRSQRTCTRQTLLNPKLVP